MLWFFRLPPKSHYLGIRRREPGEVYIILVVYYLGIFFKLKKCPRNEILWHIFWFLQFLTLLLCWCYLNILETAYFCQNMLVLDGNCLLDFPLKGVAGGMYHLGSQSLRPGGFGGLNYYFLLLSPADFQEKIFFFYGFVAWLWFFLHFVIWVGSVFKIWRKFAFISL